MKLLFVELLSHLGRLASSLKLFPAKIAPIRMKSKNFVLHRLVFRYLFLIINHLGNFARYIVLYKKT